MLLVFGECIQVHTFPNVGYGVLVQKPFELVDIGSVLDFGTIHDILLLYDLFHDEGGRLFRFFLHSILIDILFK